MTCRPTEHKYHARWNRPGRGGCTSVLAGWAACCYGKRAEKIRADGTHTYFAPNVTCLRCVALLQKAGVLPRAGEPL